jgi:hypothetical protein
VELQTLTVNELVSLIQGLGFPAAIAFFVLWRLEKQLGELTKAIVELKLALYRDPGLRPEWPAVPQRQPRKD